MTVHFTTFLGVCVYVGKTKSKLLNKIYSNRTQTMNLECNKFVACLRVALGNDSRKILCVLNFEKCCKLFHLRDLGLFDLQFVKGYVGGGRPYILDADHF